MNGVDDHHLVVGGSGPTGIAVVADPREMLFVADAREMLFVAAPPEVAFVVGGRMLANVVVGLSWLHVDPAERVRQ